MPQAFALVTAAQIATLTGIAAISFFRIPELAPPKLRVVPHYVHSIPLVAAVRTAPASPVSNHSPKALRQFYAPPRIPPHAANIAELLPSDIAAVPGISASGASGSSVPGAIDFTGNIPPPPVPAKQTANPKQQPLRVTSSVQQAKLIREVIPVYPKLAIETRQHGNVRLVATVGKDGRVKEVRVVSGPAFLAAAAVEAVKQWLYRPTLLNGNPVGVIAPIDVNFILSE